MVELPEIRISSLKRVAEECRQWRATHVVSLLDPDIQAENLPMLSRHVNHDRFFFYDEDESSGGRQLEVRLESILTCLWKDALRQRSNRLIIHCHAGASRSPALLYILLCQAMGNAREEDAFARLLQVTNKPWPNRQMIASADQMLGRDGKMLAPIGADIRDGSKLTEDSMQDAAFRVNASSATLRLAGR